MDLFCICCCLISCLRFCLEGAEVDDTVGGQVCVDASDSSDSVIDGDERLRLCDACKASLAFEAAFRFGSVGGSAISIDVCGRVNGGAKLVTVSVGGCGGAGTAVFFGFVSMRVRNALETFQWMDETALTSSAILLCLIFLFPSIFGLASLACWLTRSSLIFPVGTFGLLSA